MHKVRGMVSCEGKVIRDGIALILGSIKNFEVLGRDGGDILKEAFDLQPDLILYKLHDPETDEDEQLLVKLRESCSWTKIILLGAGPMNCRSLQKYIGLCNGYLQRPLLPGFLHKAVELACYSQHFFFLGSTKELSNQINENIQE